MASHIHATAVIADGAKIGADCVIGPYCVIGKDVTLGDRCKLHSHVVIDGITEIGEETEVFPFSSLGHRPQDLKFKGEASKLVIGKRNIIREHVTMNPGTEGGGMLTQVGDNCLFMAATHVAHDCMLGNNIVMANHATLAGHVTVHDNVIIGGLAAVHQFVRLGVNCFVGGMAGVTKDLVPYGMVTGDRASLEGLNVVGLKRRNLTREQIAQLRSVFKALFYGEGTLSERANALSGTDTGPEAKTMIDFILSDSSRSFCTPSLEAREAA